MISIMAELAILLGTHNTLWKYESLFFVKVHVENGRTWLSGCQRSATQDATFEFNETEQIKSRTEYVFTDLTADRRQAFAEWFEY